MTHIQTLQLYDILLTWVIPNLACTPNNIYLYRPIYTVQACPYSPEHRKEGTIFTIICLSLFVGVRKRHVVILARSPREMSQTDRILPRYILSRVRVSVRPRNFFIREKKPKPDSPACCLFQVVGSALRPDKTTELDNAEPTKLGGVALTRRAINYDVSDCGVQGSEFKPRAGKISFSLLLFVINKAYS